MDNPKTLALIGILGVIGGSAWVATSVIKSVAPPLTLVAIRLTISWIVLSVSLGCYSLVCLIRGKPINEVPFGEVYIHDPKRWSKFWFNVSILSFLNQVLPYPIYILCMNFGLNTAISSVLSGAGPLMSVLIRKIADVILSIFIKNSSDSRFSKYLSTYAGIGESFAALDIRQLKQNKNNLSALLPQYSAPDFSDDHCLDDESEIHASGRYNTIPALHNSHELDLLPRYHQCGDNLPNKNIFRLQSPTEDNASDGSSPLLANESLPSVQSPNPVYDITNSIKISKSNLYKGIGLCVGFTGVVFVAADALFSSPPSSNPVVSIEKTNELPIEHFDSEDNVEFRRIMAVNSASLQSFHGNNHSLKDENGYFTKDDELYLYKNQDDSFLDIVFDENISLEAFTNENQNSDFHELELGDPSHYNNMTNHFKNSSSVSPSNPTIQHNNNNLGNRYGFLALILFLSATMSKSVAAVWAEQKLTAPELGFKPFVVSWGQNTMGMLLSWLFVFISDLPFGFHAGSSQFDAGMKFFPFVRLTSVEDQLHDSFFQRLPTDEEQDTIFGLLYVGILASAATYIMQFILIREVGSVQSMLVNFIVPVVGLTEGVLLCGNWVGKGFFAIFFQILGVVFIFGGLKFIRSAHQIETGIFDACDKEQGVNPLMQGEVNNDKIKCHSISTRDIKNNSSSFFTPLKNVLLQVPFLQTSNGSDSIAPTPISTDGRMLPTDESAQDLQRAFIKVSSPSSFDDFPDRSWLGDTSIIGPLGKEIDHSRTVAMVQQVRQESEYGKFSSFLSSSFSYGNKDGVINNNSKNSRPGNINQHFEREDLDLMHKNIVMQNKNQINTQRSGGVSDDVIIHQSSENGQRSISHREENPRLTSDIFVRKFLTRTKTEEEEMNDIHFRFSQQFNDSEIHDDGFTSRQPGTKNWY